MLATRRRPTNFGPAACPDRLDVQLSNAQLRNLKSIEGADFTDALMRKDVQMSLCKIARGVNPKTGVATADSLGCP